MPMQIKEVELVKYNEKTDQVTLELALGLMTVLYEDIIPAQLSDEKRTAFIQGRSDDYEFFLLREIYPEMQFELLDDAGTIEAMRTWVMSDAGKTTPKQVTRMRTQRIEIEQKKPE